MRHRWVLIAALLLGAFAFAPTAETAQACPMCKTANESEKEDRRPQAYMYSILFMLTVPATIFTGLGYGLYRMSKNEQTALDASDDFSQPAE